MAPGVSVAEPAAFPPGTIVVQQQQQHRSVGRRVMLGFNVALLAASVLLLLAGLGSEEPALLVVAAGAFLLLLLIAPTARWGPTGLLLAPGVALLVTGFVFGLVGQTAENVNEKFVGDDDQDGRIDEDPPGDADHSQNDPTQINGASELADPRDDDSDGRVDEDPAPLREVSTVKEIAKDLAWSLGLAGAAILVLFGFLVGRVNAHRRQSQQQQLVVVAPAGATIAARGPGKPG